MSTHSTTASSASPRVNDAVESIADRNSSFSKEVPGLQIAWDATSLSLLKTCPAKYFMSIIEGWESRRRSPHLTFGIILHEAIERYSRAKAEGMDHQEAQREAVFVIYAQAGERDEHGTWQPWQSDDPAKTLQSLFRTVIWYLEEFRDDAAQVVRLSNGKPACELSFRFEIPDFVAPDGNPYIFCGHIDSIVEFAEQRWVMDHKTSKAALGREYFKRYTPDNQMSMYALASKVVFGEPVRGVMVNGMQVAVNFSRFHRGFAHRTEAMLNEWLADTMTWIKFAEHFAMARHWPMNDLSCDKYGGCPYRDICASDPSVRLDFLRGNFQSRTWDPLQTRGE
jgi:hypothetical protein